MIRKNLKTGLILTAGAAVAYVFARGIKGIIDDVAEKDDKCDDFDDDDDYDEDFESELKSIFDDDDDDDCDCRCSKNHTSESHENFTEVEDDFDTQNTVCADEAAEQAVSSDNLK